MATQGRSLPVFLLAVALLAGGGFLYSVTGRGTYLPRLLLLSGTACLVWGIVRLWPTLVLFFVRMRQVAEPGPALTWLLAGAVLLVCTAGLGVRRVRFDVTSRGLHSLSATSRAALVRIRRPIELIGVYREGSPQQEEARDALDAYRTGVPAIRTQLLDPERRPDLARRLRIDFSGGMLVLSDSIRDVVTDLSEQSITEAILRVTEPSRPVVAILEGHGETAENRSGLSRLYDTITRAGFKWRRLRIAESGAIPPDVRVVLVAGPNAPLLPGEVIALERFLNGGGRAGILLDPGPLQGLGPILEPARVAVDGRPVTDDGPLTRSVGLGPETIAVQTLGEHAITGGLTSAIILPGATRCGLIPGPATLVHAVDLLKSAPSARLVGARRDSTGAGSAPIAGPLPLGVALDWEVPPAPGALAHAAEPEKPDARLVVVGDSDFLRDSGIDLYGNLEFTSRLLGWLGQKEYLLRFPVVDRSGTPLKVGLGGLRTIFYLVEVLLPLSLLGLGVMVWVRRR